MGFVESIESAFRKYFVWKGRASRSEFWWFYLFYTLGSIVTVLVDLIYGLPVLNTVFILVTLFPNLSVFIRRLHDTGHSGWWYWIAFTIIGIIPLIYWMCKAGDDGDNNYASNPLKN